MKRTARLLVLTSKQSRYSFIIPGIRRVSCSKVNWMRNKIELPSLNVSRYQKKSPIEHILLRPDTYIGSTQMTEENVWVYNPEKNRIVRRNIQYVPALLKIFDEILVNAADNKQRDPKMNEIRITVDESNGKISVFNNGRGLPVEMHPEEGIYIPTLIFGHLFTSSNYDDNQIKVVGGRNGYGAKLCNIFSSEFSVETVQADVCFRQTWYDNMSRCSNAEVSTKTGQAEHTLVTFKPDLAKFGLKQLDGNICDLFYRRAIDVAGTLKGVDVYYNGKKVEVGGFREYASLFAERAEDVFYGNLSRRWQIAIIPSESDFQQMSFVNNIATNKGGRHVDYIVDQVIRILKVSVEKKLKKSNITVRPNMIKNRLFVLVNSVIENPSFDSQGKDFLTTKQKDFGSAVLLDPCEIDAWAESSGVLNAILEDIERKHSKVSSRTSHKSVQSVSDIHKLEDANWAGSGKECTLIVTEGDSAKAMAVAGLEVTGRDRYGVFPIRGKIVNVSNMSEEKALQNAEIASLMRILGLRFSADYSDPEQRKALRYSHVMILADQDDDGSHIKGLLINLFHEYWPSLIQHGFIMSFVTPLLKARKGTESISFYSTKDYKRWRLTKGDLAEKYSIKYYKGLGTSTANEAREYFSDMERHVVKFVHSGEEDDEKIGMVFDKDKAEERKQWITSIGMNNDSNEAELMRKEVTITDFVDQELINYSLLDLKRSIPSVVDGLKPSQRKVLHTLLSKKNDKEIKVSPLASEVTIQQAYHHGEDSLVNTIVRLAQTFVGSNNVALLEPVGQFGTRHEGGNDAASARYIHTKLSPNARAIFPNLDDSVMELQTEENQTIEPKWLCPIIPLVLVNGAEGIGTGWRSKIPNHSLKEVADNVRRMIEGKEAEKMLPSYYGFTGFINEVRTNQYEVRGIAQMLPEARKNSQIVRVSITELPIGTWTNRYKESVLLPLSKEEVIRGFKEYHTERSVHFVVDVSREHLKKTNKDLLKLFKLNSSLTFDSMVLFDANGVLTKYPNTMDIMKDHFRARQQKYLERKEYLIQQLDAQLRTTENQLRFVESFVSGGVSLLQGRTRKELEDQLRNNGFEDDPMKKLRKQPANLDYLLDMPISRICTEEIAKLIEKKEQRTVALEEEKRRSWQDTWMRELNLMETVSMESHQ